MSRPMLLLLLAACGGEPAPQGATPAPAAAGAPATPAEAPAPAAAQPGFEDHDQGQQHPPLPADSPGWEWDAGGFVPDHGWYGEHSWHDVRMRLMGHLAVIAWAQAQAAAMSDRPADGAEALERLEDALQALPEPPEGPARTLRDTLRGAAERDAALLRGLGEARPLADAPPAPGLAGLRWQLLAQATAPAPDPDALRQIQEALRPYLELRTDLDLDAFADFHDRHRLRGALWQAWADALDPTHAHHPWGYWEPAELQREALALGIAAGWMGGADWSSEVGPVPGVTAPDGAGSAPDGEPRWRWPGAAAARLQTHTPAFSATELGRLPTGDSLIDVGGAPGPRAIGTLERLGLDDPTHAGVLAARAAELDALLREDPAAVPAGIRALADQLDRYPHGSRYYNVKQARNAGVRQLARAGRPDLARALLADHRPLHHQDWACPNRSGILRTLEGRLTLADAGPAAARPILEQAWTESMAFLEQVAAAEAAGPGRGPGARPPWMRGGPPAGRPPHRPRENTATAPHSSTGAPSSPRSHATPSGSAAGSATTHR